LWIVAKKNWLAGFPFFLLSQFVSLPLTSRSLESDEASPPPADCRPMAPFLSEGGRGNPLSTVLFVPGESLGPVWLGSNIVSTVLPFSMGLLGTRRFRVLGAWWGQDRGRSGCGSSSSRRFTIDFISLYFWACCCCCPRIFLCFEMLYWCGCYINIEG
jgi:hypothetical protein